MIEHLTKAGQNKLIFLFSRKTVASGNSENAFAILVFYEFSLFYNFTKLNSEGYLTFMFLNATVSTLFFDRVERKTSQKQCKLFEASKPRILTSKNQKFDQNLFV